MSLLWYFFDFEDVVCIILRESGSLRRVYHNSGIQKYSAHLSTYRQRLLKST